MMGSLHRLADGAPLGTGPVLDEETRNADQEQAARYLQAASDQGIGPASFNLASLFVMGYGGSWEERKHRAAELYAKAHAQGFTAFGQLMNRDGPGQPYLRLLEEDGRIPRAAPGGDAG
jgi:TPR repeat protein